MAEKNQEKKKKLEVIRATIKNPNAPKFTTYEEFEDAMKNSAEYGGPGVRSAGGSRYVDHDKGNSIIYTHQVLSNNPKDRRALEELLRRNRREQGLDPEIPDKPGRGRGKRRSASNAGWDEDDWGGSGRGGRGGSSRGGSDLKWSLGSVFGVHGDGSTRRYRHRKSPREILFGPLGVVLAVLAVCVLLYTVVGPAMYALIMDGPFFKILLMILAGAAVVGVLKSANGWPSGVKFVVVLVIGLVLLYSVVGPAIYAFLMSGILFKLICLGIAVAATIGILKGDLGWPIGVKLVVIVVIWAVIKDQVL